MSSTVMVCMITVGIIRNVASRLSHHLRKNDYWAEGEKAVRGEWIGEGAETLGLSGEVTDKPFESLRINRNPTMGESLTARDHTNWVSFIDVQLADPQSSNSDRDGMAGRFADRRNKGRSHCV